MPDRTRWLVVRVTDITWAQRVVGSYRSRHQAVTICVVRDVLAWLHPGRTCTYQVWAAVDA